MLTAPFRISVFLIILFASILPGVDLPAQTGNRPAVYPSGRPRELRCDAIWTTVTDRNTLPEDFQHLSGLTLYACPVSGFDLLRAENRLLLRGVGLPDGRRADLELEQFTVFSAATTFIEMTPAGPRPLPPPDITLYRGRVADQPESFVYLAVEKDGISGSIRIGSAEFPVGSYRPASSPRTAMILIREKLPAESATACGVKDDVDGRIDPASLLPAVKDLSFRKSLMDTLAAKVAIDADYECTQHYGSAAAAQTYITARFGEVSAIYTRDMAIRLEISFFRVWTDSNDPYTGADMGTCLSEVTNYWKANMDTVSRALTVLISRRTLDGFDAGVTAGLAALDALCSKNRGYAFDRLSANNNFISGNTGVLAHEIGHVFGSRHTHSCWWNPPIDSCAGPEDGTCFTGNRPVNGEIMSYCGNKTNEFRGRIAPFIRQRAQAANCLTIFSQIRSIVVNAPAGGESWCIGTSHPINWISTGVTFVRIALSSDGGATFPVILADSIPAPAGSWNWTIPGSLNAGTQFRVRITDAQVGTPIAVSGGNFELKAGTKITQQPQGATVCIGANVTLTVAGTGSGTVTYQWKKNGTDIPGKTAATLQLNNVSKADSAVYSAVVSAGCGSVTSTAVTVTVNQAPTITRQPENTTGCLGKAARIFIDVTGDNLTFKWYKDLTLVPNAATSSINFTSVSQNDQGSYFCQVSSPCGPVISNTAYLTIGVPALALNAPAGGEKFGMGENLIIQWSATCVQKVKLEYSTNGGQSWSTIISDFDAVISQYLYKLPNASTDKARVRISDASNGTVVKESGNFTVSASPVIQLSRTTIDFGSVFVGQTKSQTITVGNTGLGQLDVTKTEISGSPMFMLTNGGAFTLAAAGSRDLTVQFTPTAGGAQTASLRIDHNATGSPATVSITGNAIVSAVVPEVSAPDGFQLLQNFPNPFADQTIIEIRTTSASDRAALTVHDHLGREVLRMEAPVTTGTGSVFTLHASQLPSPGLYHYRVSANGLMKMKSMVFIR